MSISKTEASALSRVFSAAVLRDFGRVSRSTLFTRLISQTRVPQSLSRPSTVGMALEEAFRLLKTPAVRDDYVYRSAITQKIVLGRHSLSTATLLSEIRTGPRRADLVVLNGTATAYEIKSERDSLHRLRNQVDRYRLVFATVNVVVGATHVAEVLRATADDVGVLTLSDRYTLQTEREPLSRPDRTVPAAILDVLRIEEAEQVLRRLGQPIPLAPNTEIRTEFKRVFTNLDPTLVHDQMVNVLRTSRSQAPLSGFLLSLPPSIRAAVLASRPNSLSRTRILEAINTPLVEALAWK